MTRFMIALATVVAILAVAACGGTGEDSSGSSPVAQPGSAAATVSVKELGDSGRVLVDSAGKALYAADEEANSGVVCTGDCASFWIPLTIDGDTPSGSSLQSDLGVIERGGAKQVTFEGMRLYTFVEDELGEVSGDGLSDEFGGQRFTWHVVRVDPADSNQEVGTPGGSFDY